MKNYLTSLLLILLIPTLGFSNFSLNFGNQHLYGAPNNSINFNGSLINSLSATQTYKITISNPSLPGNWPGISFCTPTTCFPLNQATATFQINPNDSGALIIEMHTGTTIGTGTVDVIFENLTTPTPPQTITLTGTINPFSLSHGFSDTTICNSNTTEYFWLTANNNVSSALSVEYKIMNIVQPNGWLIEACDPVPNCFTGIGNSSSFSIPALDYSNIKVKVTPDTSNGIAEITIRLTDIGDTTVYEDVTFYAIVTSGTTGINETSNNSSFSFYPNPAKDNLALINHFDHKMIVEIYNSIGKIVKKQSLLANETSSINLTNLNSGIYFISYLNNKGIKTSRKLIIQ